MKLTIQKIFLSILAIAISIAAAVIGMYMIFLAEMIFRYRLLFSAIFMFNPILTGFLIAYMFKKQAPKEPKEPDNTDRKKKRRDDNDHDEPASYSAPSSYAPQPAPYTPPQETMPTVSAADSFSAASPDSAQTSGYDLPGSETYTNYGDTVNAQDVSDAEASKSNVVNKLKFWAKSSDAEEKS